MAEGRGTVRVERPDSIQVDAVRAGGEGGDGAAVCRRGPELGGQVATRGERRGERRRVQSVGESELATSRRSVVAQQALPPSPDQRELPPGARARRPHSLAVDRSDRQPARPDGTRRARERSAAAGAAARRPQAELQRAGGGRHGHGSGGERAGPTDGGGGGHLDDHLERARRTGGRPRHRVLGRRPAAAHRLSKLRRVQLEPRARRAEHQLFGLHQSQAPADRPRHYRRPGERVGRRRQTTLSTRRRRRQQRQQERRTGTPQRPISTGDQWRRQDFVTGGEVR